MDSAVSDAFVFFGITGDLARKMTFRSLYRLERRELLNIPVLGVAGDDWRVEQLVDRARESIEPAPQSASDRQGEQNDPSPLHTPALGTHTERFWHFWLDARQSEALPHSLVQ